jgi:hypothetical protein
VNDVGVDAVGQRHARYRGAGQPRLGNDLVLEFRAVQASLGCWGKFASLAMVCIIFIVHTMHE